MKKVTKILILIAGAALLLASCQSAAPAVEASNPPAAQAPANEVPAEEPAGADEAPAAESAEALADESAAQPESNPPAPSEAGETPAENITCQVSKSPFPPVQESDWILGNQDAKVTILEYSDFQCPYCSMIAPVLEKITKENSDVRLVYRHFPLISIHDKAALSTQASEAAGMQGKFWEMHWLLFDKQSEWSALEVEKFKSWLIERSAALGLDKDQFAKDLTSEKLSEFAQKTFDESAGMGLPGTPTLVINGVFYGGDPSYESLSAYIKKAADIKMFDACPEMTIDPAKKYTATLKMDKGDIVIELFADKAPVTVNNFVFLAREGWYDGVTFHRVLKDFVAQGGDPYGTGTGGPGYQYINEIAPELTFGDEGVLGMANAGPDTNGSQFFITYDGIPDETVKQLDGNYTIFGKVISGMDVVKGITLRDPSQNPNLPAGDVINSITIEEK